MITQLSIRTALLSLLAFMTLLLAVSGMGIYAINSGNQSFDAINRIQGIELNSLYQSNADLMRVCASAALAVRKIEIGLLDGMRVPPSPNRRRQMSPARNAI